MPRQGNGEKLEGSAATMKPAVSRLKFLRSFEGGAQKATDPPLVGTAGIEPFELRRALRRLP